MNRSLALVVHLARRRLVACVTGRTVDSTSRESMALRSLRYSTQANSNAARTQSHADVSEVDDRACVPKEAQNSRLVCCCVMLSSLDVFFRIPLEFSAIVCYLLVAVLKECMRVLSSAPAH